MQTILFKNILFNKTRFVSATATLTGVQMTLQTTVESTESVFVDSLEPMETLKELLNLLESAP